MVTSSRRDILDAKDKDRESRTYPLLQPEEGAQDLKNFVKHLGALMSRDGWTGGVYIVYIGAWDKSLTWIHNDSHSPQCSHFNIS